MSTASSLGGQEAAKAGVESVIAQLGPFWESCKLEFLGRTGPFVYVAGPITQGDQITNSRNLLEAAEQLFKLGCIPFCPGLSLLHHFVHPHTGPEWLGYDMRWIDKCDAVLVLPGPSMGAAAEVLHARLTQKPVFTNVAALMLHYRGQL